MWAGLVCAHMDLCRLHLFALVCAHMCLCVLDGACWHLYGLMCAGLGLFTLMWAGPPLFELCIHWSFDSVADNLLSLSVLTSVLTLFAWRI